MDFFLGFSDRILNFINQFVRTVSHVWKIKKAFAAFNEREYVRKENELCSNKYPLLIWNFFFRKLDFKRRKIGACFSEALNGLV